MCIALQHQITILPTFFLAGPFPLTAAILSRLQWRTAVEIRWRMRAVVKMSGMILVTHLSAARDSGRNIAVCYSVLHHTLVVSYVYHIVTVCVLCYRFTTCRVRLYAALTFSVLIYIFTSRCYIFLSLHSFT